MFHRSHRALRPAGFVRPALMVGSDRGGSFTLTSNAPAAVTGNIQYGITSTAATLAGQTDVLTVAQAQAFFDSVSPAGYLGYANAMRDQANTFQRQVALRMTDQNSDHAEDGFWFQAGGNVFGKAARGTPNSRETGYQIDFGYDVSGPKYILGAAFSYSQGHLTYGLGNLVGHNNAYMFGGYGAYHLGPLVASGKVSYQLGTFSANKVITAGATTTTTAAHSTDRLLTASAALGGEIKAAGLSLTPFVGIVTRSARSRPLPRPTSAPPISRSAASAPTAPTCWRAPRSQHQAEVCARTCAQPTAARSAAGRTRG